jgi:hypothetical protein
MVSDEQLDAWRVAGIVVKVVRDAEAVHDVKGIVVAWDDEVVMIRKQNRKIVRLSREYQYLPWQT